MTETVPSIPPRPTAGLVGLLFGAAALILVLVHFWAGPFAPQQDAAVSIGEIAAEIRNSAVRGLTGQPQPAPEAAPWDIDRVLDIATAILAGLAVIAGLAAFVRHENKRLATSALVLGGGAVLFQLFTWTILLIIGAMLMVAIMENMGGILGD